MTSPENEPSVPAQIWDQAKHEAPFGHCAGCGQDLPIHTGGDGKSIISAGFCRDCDLMTVWEIVDAR